MTTNNILNHLKLYRLPWTLPDNAISWLEPTSACNLSCDGCYRENIPGSHKSIETVRKELETLRRLRNADGISIAGGDPLLHPEIVEIVRIISKMKFKPIINTNGSMLTKELLIELKKAGVYGFTFHIDSRQNRPGWEGKNEVELNSLRLYYAEMLADVGNISCAFNSTVYDNTLQYTPDLLEWAAKHIDIVQVMVFILYRAVVPQLPFDWYAGGTKINLDILAYNEKEQRKIDILSLDVLDVIHKKLPDFMPCAYLNGTEKVDSLKWLLTGRIGTREKIYGYAGPKFMEIIQTMHHMVKGKYLAYSKPKTTRSGKLMFLLLPFDYTIRQAVWRYLCDCIRNPISFFKRLHYQSIMIIQPVDFMENGAQNMCDGCPDITVWNSELAWSCRLEELKHFGCWVRCFPKNA